MDWYGARGGVAARLRKRKYELIRQFGLPTNLLPGSLALTRRRCGKAACHCASGKGHPMWSLTFMVKGTKHVERIPEQWVRRLRPLVQGGRLYKTAVAELLACNAQLLALRRRQVDRQHRRPKR